MFFASAQPRTRVERAAQFLDRNFFARSGNATQTNVRNRTIPAPSDGTTERTPNECFAMNMAADE